MRVNLCFHCGGLFAFGFCWGLVFGDFFKKEKNSFHSLPAISMELKFPAKTLCPNENILSRK